MPREDRRIRKTREAINTAFIDLLAERDFDKVTINDIAERANVNRGTFYLHYVDKFDLLDKCIEEHLKHMLEFCALVKPGAEGFDVFDSLLSMFQYFEEFSLFYSSMLTNKGISCFHDRLLLVVRHAMNERMKMGGMNRGVSNEIVVEFMASAFVGVVEWWIKNNMLHTPQFMAQQLRNIFENSQLLSQPMLESKHLS